MTLLKERKKNENMKLMYKKLTSSIYYIIISFMNIKNYVAIASSLNKITEEYSNKNGFNRTVLPHNDKLGGCPPIPFSHITNFITKID